MFGLRQWCRGLAATVGLVALSSAAPAAAVSQYATSVIDYSTQWSSSSWSAAQTLGAPNTFGYGDISTSWAPTSHSGTLEYVTVGYDTPVYADGVTVRETSGNGFVYQIDVLDLSDILHTVWSGTDPSLPGTPVDFLATWARTSYLVKGVKVHTNTSHSSTWEEIDSIQLHGDTSVAGDGAVAVPLPASVWAGLGLMGLLAMRKARSRAAC